MAQPISGEQFATVGTGVGTNVVSAIPATIHRIIFPGTYVGTLNIHDSATAAGTTATSQIISFGLPTTTVAGNVEFGIACSKGITYQATGTPVCTLVWGM